MRFIKRSKAHKRLFVYFSEYGVFVARWSSGEVPTVLEFAREFSGGDIHVVRPFLEEVGTRKEGSLVSAICGFSTPDRFLIQTAIQNAPLFREQQYASNFLNRNYELGEELKQVHILNPERGLGSALGPTTSGREVLFCGCPKNTLDAMQRKIIEYGVYPERLELISVSTIAAMMVHMKLAYINTPVVVLDISMNATTLIILDRCAVGATRIVRQGIDVWVHSLQEKLGLQDSEVAKRLLYSGSFDFKEMGPELLGAFIEEIRSAINFYEIKSGRTAGHIWLTGAPSHLVWMGECIAERLGVNEIIPSLSEWLEVQGIVADPSIMSGFEGSLFRLFSLMGNYHRDESKT